MPQTRTARPAKGVKRPGPVAAPAPDPYRDLPEGTYREFPVLADLPALVAQYRDLQIQLAAAAVAEKQKKALGEQIEALLLVAEAPSVTVGSLKVLRVEMAGRETISADKLLAQGVDADVIKEATVRGKPSSYVRVTPVDGEAEAARSEQHRMGDATAAGRRRSA